jgi:type IV pilus assembly protein PilB
MSRSRFLSPEKPDQILEIQMGVFVEVDLLREFPRETARRFRVVPLRRLGKGLVVAAAEEVTRDRLKLLTEELRKPVCAITCQLRDLDQILNTLYESDARHRKLGEILQKEEVISPDELDRALEHQRTEAKPLGQILLDLGLVSREELAVSLSGQERENNPSLLSSLFIDRRLTQVIPEATARRYGILPLVESDDELVVAAGRHLDHLTMSELKSLTGREVRVIPAVVEELREALEKTYGVRKARLRELRLGEVLVEEELINTAQLGQCLAIQKGTGKKLGEILTEKGFVSEDAVLRTVAAKLGCEYRRFATAEIDLEISRFLPKRFAEQNQVVMLARDPKTREVLVAMADPADLNLQDILAGILAPHGLRMRPVLASPSNIQAGIAYVYHSRGLVESAEEMETVETERSEDLIDSLNMPEIKRIVNQLLYSAVTEGASDIHIENLEAQVHVRFRIDGVLEDRLTPVTKENIANVISILKVDSGLDIAERRRSQDGVFKKRIGRERFIDFRINVHATPFGEDAVIRILDRQKNLLPLEKLGFSDGTLENYLRLVENPQGLILFTGPTGSGKTTTLYSTLSYLNKGNRKIVTAEDPIEYVLEGISQYQVHEAIGNTFDDYARRFLRKDPDIILIGEIRDSKTARACVNASMTGHLVFSTLHTNDAVGVVRRLQNLEVPSAMIADSLLLVVSQRLARRVCSQCREPHEPDPRLLRDFFPKGVPSGLRFVRGIGCDACRLKGYRGRVGLYEFWEIKTESRRFISRGAGEEELRQGALEEGMRVLLADALAKVATQLTTLEELSRVVSIDQLQRYAKLL